MAYNLIRPNNEELFCKNLYTDNIILPNDTGGVVSVDCALYSQTGPTSYVLQRGGMTLKYLVHKNALVIFLNSSTGDFLLNGTNTQLYLGPYDIVTNQPINWHIPYKIVSGDGDMCTVINIKLNNGTSCKLQFNTDVLGVPGDSIIWLFPHSPDNGTNPGTFSNGVTCNICNFCFFVPVEYVG